MSSRCKQKYGRKKLSESFKKCEAKFKHNSFSNTKLIRWKMTGFIRSLTRGRHQFINKGQLWRNNPNRSKLQSHQFKDKRSAQDHHLTSLPSRIKSSRRWITLTVQFSWKKMPGRLLVRAKGQIKWMLTSKCSFRLQLQTFVKKSHSLDQLVLPKQ